MTSDFERYKILLIKIIIILATLVTVYFLLDFFFPLILNISSLLMWGFMPFILAIIITILIDPIVDYLNLKRGINRGVAVAGTLLILFSIVILLVILFVSRMVIELTNLYSSIPEYTQHLMNYIINIVEQIRIYITNNPLPAEANDALKSNLQIAIREITDILTSVTNFLLALLKGLPVLFTVIIVSGVATFFFSRDKAVIAKFIYKIIPQKYVRPSSMVIGEISLAIVGFFRAQTILISITGLLTVLGLSFLGVNYALTIGIIVGIFDLLPILGPGTVLVPWVIIAMIIGKYGFGVALLVLYGVLITVRQLIEPKILSHNIGLHPLATLIALYVGLRFIGVWGIIIGPFLVILIKAIFKSINPVNK